MEQVGFYLLHWQIGCLPVVPPGKPVVLVHQDISVNYNCQLPSASTRIKSYAAAAADFQHPLKGGEQK